MLAYTQCAHKANKTSASCVTSSSRTAIRRGRHAAAAQDRPSLTTAAAATSSSRENPDLDEIVLDDAYYQEIGMTREEAMRQQQEILTSVDPEAVPLLDNLSSVAPDSLPPDLRAAVESLEVYGPQALVLAGFRAEEYAVIRATLDSLGAQQVKVLPASNDMLNNNLELALQEPEIDWSAPRPPEWILGGTWGSQRTVMFSGLSIKAQATLLEVLEAQGLPHLCVTMALETDKHNKLGDVMAQAVKAQRGYKPTPIAPWENTGAATATASAAAQTNSTRNSSSSSGPRRASSSAAPWVPGKKGRLFQRSSGSGSGSRGGSSSDAVLEPLQDLIPPEVARARLQFGPSLSTSSTRATPPPPGFPQPPQNSSSSQSAEASWAAGAGEDDQTATRLPDPGSSDTDLLDWFNTELEGTSVELSWNDGEDGAAAAAAVAAAAGFGSAAAGDETFWQAGAGGKAAGDAEPVSLDDLFAAAEAAAGPSGEGSNGAANNNSSSNSLFDQLLPNAARPSAAAEQSYTASSSNGGWPGFDNQLVTDQGLQLDDQNPDAGPSSMLSAIQAALKSGVSAEQLKQLIDVAATEGARATDDVDLLLNEDAAAAVATPKPQQGPAANPQQMQDQIGQQQQQRPYGPQPPPPGSAPAAAAAAAAGGGGGVSGGGDADGLLKLRPEVEAAFANKQVKFVDLSRLPKKYKQRYNLDALRQQREQQQQRMQQQQEEEEQHQREAAAMTGPPPPIGGDKQRWWQQQSKRQQLAQSLPGQVLGQIPAGGRVVKVDMTDAAATAAAGIAAVGGGQGRDDDDDDDGANFNTNSSSSRVKPLYDVGGSSSSMQQPYQMASGFNTAAAAADGTFAPSGGGQYDAEYEDVTAAAAGDIADAGAAAAGDDEGEDDGEGGSSEPELVLDALKLQQLVDSAQQEGLDVSRALAEAVAFGVTISSEAAAAVGVQLPGAADVESARRSIVASIRDMQEEQEHGAAAGVQQEGGHLPPQQELVGSGVNSSRQGGSSSSSSRSWGAGLSAAAQRAKARRQQQQQ